MNSLKVRSFSLLFLSNGLWIPDGYAMDPPYEKGASPQDRVVPQTPRLQVVSPEAVEIEQQLKQHVQLYPDVADSNPKIQTLEDFKNAKTYLILFEKYNYCLHGVLMASMSNPIAIDACLGYESGLIHYAQTLGRDSSLPFRSAQDEVDLRRILYAGYYRLGIARLEDFHISQSSLPLDQQIKKLELVTQILPILYQSPDSRHFLDFKRYVQLRTAASFSQMELNHPFMLSKPSLRKFIIDDQEELKRAAASVSSDELEKFRERYAAPYKSDH